MPKRRQRTKPRRRFPSLDELVRDYDPTRYFTIALEDDPLPGDLPTVEVKPLSRDYRAHLKKMAGLPYEKAIAAVGRAVQADDDDEDLEGDGTDIRIMLAYDVRYRPDYWLRLKAWARRQRGKAATKMMRKAEARFSFNFKFDERRHRTGRPRVDAKDRIDRARSDILADYENNIRPFVRGLPGRDRDEPMTPQDRKKIADFARKNFAGAPAKKMDKFVERLRRRSSLEPRQLEGAPLHVRHALPEGDILSIIRRHQLSHPPK